MKTARLAALGLATAVALSMAPASGAVVLTLTYPLATDPPSVVVPTGGFTTAFAVQAPFEATGDPGEEFFYNVSLVALPEGGSGSPDLLHRSRFRFEIPASGVLSFMHGFGGVPSELNALGRAPGSTIAFVLADPVIEAVPDPIPEPATLASAGLGVAMLGGAWLRKRRKRAA